MKSVMVHQFSQVPNADIPRSSFNRSFGYKTTFDFDYIYPIFCEEALPGDTFTVNPSIFARLNTPIYPLMDNMVIDLHWFWVPNRLLWANWRKFLGEQRNPGDSTDYTTPVATATATTGYAVGSIHDYMGLPTGIPDYEHSNLPLRAYTMCWNEWYRDQNLINSGTLDTDDGPDSSASYILRKRGKRHDYFTSALPWLQKGDAVDIPLGTSADIRFDGADNSGIGILGSSGSTIYAMDTDGTAGGHVLNDTGSTNANALYADLTNATAATINQLRQAFQIQKLLERDARGGTRMPEILKTHFGVDFMDVSYRPEFLGGKTFPINVTSVPQTSESGTTPQGTLAGFGTAVANGGGFSKSFTEHGWVLGLISARADLTYQQGLERKWSRSTRYDYYWPALAHIGEQDIKIKELYCQDPATDTGATGTPDNERVFGYQERWAEYRYAQSKITGKFRSTASGTLDAWHLSQEFSSLPSLDKTFMEQNTPINRVVAVTTEPDLMMDAYFNFQCARPMPLYSVPGLIDHF
jgi:hypothetical protein